MAPRRSLATATVLLTLPLGIALVAGCADTPPPPPAIEVLEGFAADAPRPEVLVALPVGPAVDDSTRLVAGYLRDRYLMGGVGVEVIWVRRGGSEPLASLERHDVNPVIFRDDRLDGWGWEHFDRRAAEWELRDRLVPQVRPATEYAPEAGVDLDTVQGRGQVPSEPSAGGDTVPADTTGGGAGEN
jgi:hypothetical protein